MKFKSIFVLFFLSAQFVWGQGGSFEEESRKFIADFSFRLENGNVTPQDLAVCQRLWTASPNETARRSFLLLVAQYHRKIAQNPTLSIETLLPTIDILETDSASNVPEKISLNSSLSIAPPEKWRLNAENALCAIEIANAFLDLGQLELALRVIDRVGREFSDESQILAAETGGDLYVKMNMNDRAFEFYSFALQVLETLKVKEYEPGKGERVFFSDEQIILKNRIEKKFKKVENLLDAEQYGPDWATYRDAREKEVAKNFLGAYLLYDNVIKSYPETIYAEASHCYQIVLLTKLSDADNIENHSNLLQDKQKKLNELRLKFQNAQKNKNEVKQQEYQTEIEEVKAFTELAASLPTGMRALETAEKRAEAFIADDETGLYRGEVMLEIGLAWLNIFIDANRAEKWLKRSREWFEKTRSLDDRLKKFRVPDKSATVSRPSRTERVQDEVWHNISYAKAEPGQLFNRRECSWYAASMEKRAISWLGLIAYAREDYARARKLWKTLYSLDSHFKAEDNSDGFTWSYVKRFLWNIDNNRGGMYAWPEQMKAFNETGIRLRLLLADTELEMQNYPPAEEKFRKLLKNPQIFRNRERYAYCSFGLGVALMYLRKKQEMEQIFVQFLPGQRFDKTASADRALWLLALQWNQRPKTKPNALNVFQIIFERYPKSPYAQESYYWWGVTAAEVIDVPTGVKHLRNYMKKYPKANKEIVLRRIDMIEHPEKYEEDNEEDNYE